MKAENKDFIVREATDRDTTSIIELLKICLGETSVKKTPQYWQWKHIDNPFGKSYVLLAFDKDKLISVRAFIRWEWEKDGRIYNAVRAVDTVTHPDYRRRGLFRKLTYDLLDKMRADGIAFVYNTPNDNSRPGNLKMGWREFLKIQLQIKTGIWLLIKNRISKQSFSVDRISTDHDVNTLLKEDISSLIERYHRYDWDKYKTNLSIDYIKWRYVDVPICKYGAILGKNNSFLLVFRLKTRGPLRELRITDIIPGEGKSVNKEIKYSIKKLLRDYNADLATITGESGYVFKQRSKKWGFINIGRKGLTVTLNALNVSSTEIMDGSLWAWGTGDMELF